MKFRLSVLSPSSNVYSVRINDPNVDDAKLGDIAAKVLATPGFNGELCKGVYVMGDILIVHEPNEEDGVVTSEEIHFYKLSAVEGLRFEKKT